MNLVQIVPEKNHKLGDLGRLHAHKTHKPTTGRGQSRSRSQTNCIGGKEGDTEPGHRWSARSLQRHSANAAKERHSSNQECHITQSAPEGLNVSSDLIGAI
eukprot:3876266-Pleurochrysis_carterae.AAC.1